MVTKAIQGGIGDDIGQFVEIGTQGRFLPELACQHAVDGVEGHAQEHPERQQQEDLTPLAVERQHGAEGEGNEQAVIVTMFAVTPAVAQLRAMGRTAPGSAA